MKDELFALEELKARLTYELEQAEEPPALLHPNMAQEYRQRIDGLFKALSDEETRLEAHEDIRALVGQIIVSPGENGEPELLLKGDLAGILSLAADRKTPAHPQDERVLNGWLRGCTAIVGSRACSRQPHDWPMKSNNPATIT